MLIFSPLRSAIAVFFFLLFFAVIAGAVCVAFGTEANPLLAPGARAASSQPAPAMHQARDDTVSPSQDPSAAALAAPGTAGRARVGT